MTKKDYELIARTLKLSILNMSKIAYESLVNDFAERLSNDNSRFDFDKFYRACGIKIE